MVTVPSSAMATNRLGWTDLPVAWAWTAATIEPGTICAPRTRAPVAPDCFRKSRRLMFCMRDMSHLLRGGADRGEDSLIGAATADVAGHPGDDLIVARVGGLVEQGRRRHDLPGLAVAALRHVVRAPCPLHGVVASRPSMVVTSFPSATDTGGVAVFPGSRRGRCIRFARRTLRRVSPPGFAVLRRRVLVRLPARPASPSLSRASAFLRDRRAADRAGVLAGACRSPRRHKRRWKRWHRSGRTRGRGSCRRSGRSRPT